MAEDGLHKLAEASLNPWLQSLESVVPLVTTMPLKACVKTERALQLM